MEEKYYNVQRKGIASGGNGYCKTAKNETCGHEEQTANRSPMNAEYEREQNVSTHLQMNFYF